MLTFLDLKFLLEDKVYDMLLLPSLLTFVVMLNCESYRDFGWLAQIQRCRHPARHIPIKNSGMSRISRIKLYHKCNLSF